MSAKTDEQSDEQLILDYLCGRKEGEALRFFDENSPEGTRAREALFRLLQSSPSRALRQLSTLIYPEASSEQARRLVFARVKGRKHSASVVRDLIIARDIADKIAKGNGRAKVDPIVEAVAADHRVGKTTAWNAWEDHKDRFQRSVRRTYSKKIAKTLE
jgi:hypothetical protein